MEIASQIKKISSETKDLRSFGQVVGTAFFILSGILYWLEKEAWPWTLGIGVFLVVTGLTVPIILKPFQKAWMTLAILMGAVVTPFVLSVLFYLVLVPMGLIARAAGKDILDEKIDSKKESYWKPKKDKATVPEDYEKQF